MTERTNKGPPHAAQCALHLWDLAREHPDDDAAPSARALLASYQRAGRAARMPAIKPDDAVSVAPAA
jgi:hypothetical protein